MTCEGAIIVFARGIIAFGSSSLGNNVFLNMFFLRGGIPVENSQRWMLFTSLHFLHSSISHWNGVRLSITLLQ